jgi:hypothetical protein
VTQILIITDVVKEPTVSGKLGREDIRDWVVDKVAYAPHRRGTTRTLDFQNVHNIPDKTFPPEPTDIFGINFKSLAKIPV